MKFLANLKVKFRLHHLSKMDVIGFLRYNLATRTVIICTIFTAVQDLSRINYIEKNTFNEIPSQLCNFQTFSNIFSTYLKIKFRLHHL